MGSDPLRVPWSEIERRLRDEWSPGEHFSIIAQTGYGKSWLVTRGLLPLWRYSLILDVKGDDETLTSDGAHRAIRGYPSFFDLARAERFRIHPPPAKQRAVFDDVFRKAYASGQGRRRAGTWVMSVDEVRIMSDMLGLARHLKTIWIYARSRGLTLIGATQAPRYVVSEFYDQPRWFAIGNLRDRRSLRRLAEIGGDTEMLMRVVPTLDWNEFLFLGPRRWAAIATYGRE